MYITTYRSKQTARNRYLSYYDIMSNNTEPISEEDLIYYKQTMFIENPTPRNELSENQQAQIRRAELGIVEIFMLLRDFEENHEEQYYSFRIPKHSGGFRTINAPNPEFKEALTKVKNILEDIKCLPHASAYAYIKGQSTLNALEKHQANNSHWFLKIDLEDFFGKCTPELIYNQLLSLYPFYYFEPENKECLLRSIKIMCLNNGLPQGTPTSPILTNLLMVPFDYQISNKLKRGTQGDHFVYTRYADDMLNSCKSDFDYEQIINHIKSIIQPHFRIKTQKTRYGSRAGTNWNLGLMLNKDNNVTLGHRKKKLLNAMLNNFLRDYSQNRHWTRTDIYELQGQLSYLKHIEPVSYEYILQKYETKYQIRYADALKNSL